MWRIKTVAYLAREPSVGGSENNLPLDSAGYVIKALFEAEQKQIFQYPFWQRIIEDRGLQPYVPQKTDLSILLPEIANNQHAGESEEHKSLKRFIRLHPESIGLPHAAIFVAFESLLPSADRIDVLFRHANQLIAIEVKPSFADEAEITRGVYQCVKYLALLHAQEIDKGTGREIRTILVSGRELSISEKNRCDALGVPAFRVYLQQESKANK